MSKISFYTLYVMACLTQISQCPLYCVVFLRCKLVDFHLDSHSSSRQMYIFWPKVIDAIAIHILDRLDYKTRLCLQIKKKRKCIKL